MLDRVARAFQAVAVCQESATNHGSALMIQINRPILERRGCLWMF